MSQPVAKSHPERDGATIGMPDMEGILPECKVVLRKQTFGEMLRQTVEFDGLCVVGLLGVATAMTSDHKNSVGIKLSPLYLSCSPQARG